MKSGDDFGALVDDLLFEVEEADHWRRGKEWEELKTLVLEKQMEAARESAINAAMEKYLSKETLAEFERFKDDGIRIEIKRAVRRMHQRLDRIEQSRAGQEENDV